MRPPEMYVPGTWRCAKCEFRLVKSYLSMSNGTITANDTAGEKCPNCDVSMWRVSWKEHAIEQGQMVDDMFDELEKLKGNTMSVTDPKFNPSGNLDIDAIKTKANELAALIEELPPTRRRSVALTQLETASMWAVKAAVCGDD